MEEKRENDKEERGESQRSGQREKKGGRARKRKVRGWRERRGWRETQKGGKKKQKGSRGEGWNIPRVSLTTEPKMKRNDSLAGGEGQEQIEGSIKKLMSCVKRGSHN